MKRLTLKEKINARYVVNDVTGCWEWSGSKTYRGYGRTFINNGALSAHRASWLVNFGEIPPGKFVCHKCDNRSCINPQHLFLGTPQENSRDRDAKGRHNRKCPPQPLCGEANPRALLTVAKVVEIRARYAAGGITQTELARQYGVANQTISRAITSGWKAVK